MASAKEIRVKVIPSKLANDFVRKNHYSGKVQQNSSLHFGVFLHNVLHGVMSFGNPIDKRKVIGLVAGTKWNEFLELNRMALDNHLPDNSESRSLSVAVRLIKKSAPQIKWILSFADGTQCGDGTIYRASGFHLTGINRNSTIYKLPSGESVAKHGTSKRDFAGAKRMEGFQLRYIYLIDKNCELTVPTIPFSEIEKRGAKMYLGKRPGSVDSCTASSQDESGGANPTPGLNYG
jgi:hypothetical protein